MSYMVSRIKAAQSLLATFHPAALDGDSVREETPTRVAKMWDELLAGYQQDPREILSKQFAVANSDMVVVKDIPLFSQCEHHLVPFFGKVHIAYIPSGKVVGLSKFARLVECYGRRLQVQERLTTQICCAIRDALEPMGVMVVVEAEHMCMTMRGIQKPGTKTLTSKVIGTFAESNKTRAEAMRLMGL